MIHIVKKYNDLYRAFLSKDDAQIYIADKLKTLHEHCCVCEECPNISYYAEHDRRNYAHNWEIISMPLENHDKIKEFIFMVYSRFSGFGPKEIDQVFATHKEAKAHIIEREEINKELDCSDTFGIAICKFRGEDDEKYYRYKDNQEIYNSL